MSADNWATCPRCIARAKEAARVAQDKVQALYGQVPIEEFDRMRSELVPFDPDSETYRTFREDYEFFGAAEGTVEAHYRGGCTVCGLSCTFVHTEKFFP